MMPMRAGKGVRMQPCRLAASPLCEQMAYAAWLREPMRERIVFISSGTQEGYAAIYTETAPHGEDSHSENQS